MKRCGHLVPFRTKSLPRPTSKARQQQRPQPSRTPPTQGVYVACVPASVRHACSFPCRLLQRGLHDTVCLLVSCLLVFVLHACSCLSRNLPRGQRGWLEQPRYLQDKVALAGQTGRGGNQREGRKQPTRWSWKDRRVEAGPVDTSFLVPLPQWFFDCRGLWARVSSHGTSFCSLPPKVRSLDG